MGANERQHFTQQLSALLERVKSYVLETCWGQIEICVACLQFIENNSLCQK